MAWSPLLRELGVPDGPGADTRSWWERQLIPADRERHREAIARLARGETQREDLRYRIRTARGPLAVRDHVFAVEHEGRPRRLVGVLRRDAEPTAAVLSDSLVERVAQSRASFETFVDSLPLLAWEADPEGWIYFYNRSWYDYTGSTPEAMEGWGWVRVHDPLDLPRMLRVWRHALQTGQPWEDEFRLRRASDGALRWHLSRAVPMRDAQGRVERWFGTNTDIHDQKLALEERERLLQVEHRLRREAEEASREKDEFLAIVSHELRSPLSAVVGWTQVLREIVPRDASEISQGIDRIARNAALQERLIEDLLDVSRIIRGQLVIERARTDVGLTVERALEAVGGAAQERKVRLEVRRESAPLEVEGSPDRLEQIVVNLVSNAIKFSPVDGRVRVDVSREGDEVVIRVQDQGEGISEELLPHLFERFRQGDSSSRRRHGGLGLGLSIVKELVRLHDGSVEASSDGPGRGACFTVRLPAARSGTVVRVRRDAADRTPASLAGIRILCVDDEPEAREVISAVLLRCGATVTAVGSVAEARARLRIERPDLIVCDLSMPEVDGYGLIAFLRADAVLADLPVLALTANASLQDERRALASGFDAYASKPFDAAALSQRIAGLVAERSVG